MNHSPGSHGDPWSQLWLLWVTLVLVLILFGNMAWGYFMN